MVTHDQPTAVRTIASALHLGQSLRAQWRHSGTLLPVVCLLRGAEGVAHTLACPVRRGPVTGRAPPRMSLVEKPRNKRDFSTTLREIKANRCAATEPVVRSSQIPRFVRHPRLIRAASGDAAQDFCIPWRCKAA